MYSSRQRGKRPQQEADHGSRSSSVGSGTIMHPSPTPIKRRDTDTVMSTSSQSEAASSPRHKNPESGKSRSNFVYPAFADIGIKLKACNDTLGTLQQLGIQHVATLPELVLVGDQSSGKSSLMSALARLDLPRSSGICTRCPFHIRMSSSNGSHWSCTISLQQDYDYRPPNRRVKESDVTRTNPLPPWVPKQARDTKVFKTIYEQDATEIEDVLRWAQVATLNPRQNHEQYVPGEGSYAQGHSLEDARTDMEARFSPNIVALEMKGPGLPDLSFYDLPGIFANAEDKEDDYLVKVVKNLTLNYVCRQEAIIMLALPMDVDKENSMTMKTIRDADAESRTIGVITKADRLGKDKIVTWLDVLQGKKETVGHGCFITSLPPNKALDKLTQHEEYFFCGGTNTWPNAFSKFGDRCGVEHLRQYITKQLGDAFSRSIPSIKEKVEIELHKIEGVLNSLPELPNNVEHVVRTSLQNFYRRAKDAVTNSDFEFQWKDLNMKFHETIVEMKPRCAGLVEPRTRPDLIEVYDSDSEPDAPVCAKRSASSQHTTFETPARKRSRQDLGITPVKPEINTATTDAFTSPSTAATSSLDYRTINQFAGCLGARIVMDVRNIRREIIAKTRVGFANIVPVEVHETLSLQAIEQWEQPLKIYMQESMAMLSRAIQNALGLSLANLQCRLIFKESQEHLDRFLDEHKALQRERLVDIFYNETYKMDTVNQKSIEQFKVQELETLERLRAYSRVRAASLLDDKTVVQPLEKMSAEERAKEKKLLSGLLAKLPNDPYKMEIEVAATVRAYYLTAATRFVDAITMDINSRLFRGFRESSLDYYLEKQLGLYPYPSPAIYDHLMEEEKDTANQRQLLKKERSRLRKAMVSIMELEDSPDDNQGPYSVNYRAPTADPINVSDRMSDLL
ncbi:P-loop containing nucleoside triphosphate hydrolase protein [Biscogniauxia marginata]|nr:P-loop containing nucleoside triphosphate hydrolase protein [Biscogniauxia marginata]